MAETHVCMAIPVLNVLTISRFCQGLSTIQKAAKIIDDAEPFYVISGLPILEYDRHEPDPIFASVDMHLNCGQRIGNKTANPYSDIYSGFHTTFYEIVDDIPEAETWKSGSLYTASIGKGKTFRKGSFTVRLIVMSV